MRSSSSSLSAHLGLLAALLGPSVAPSSVRVNRPGRITERKQDDLPRHYPGAKLARKALRGTVGRATLR